MDVLDAIDQTTDTDLDLGVEQLDDQHVDPAPKEQQQAAPEEKIDGRKFNPEWSKALKELNELYPDRKDMFTKLRDNYARYQTLQEIAPKGIDDVRAWKSTIDAVGGPEAAAEMMQRVATMEQVDAKIEAGDFSVVGDLPESMQKGFYQMLPDALSTLQEKDPQAYSAAVMPHFSAALLATGMGDHLRQMYAKADGNPELQSLIKQQYDWFANNTQNGSAKLPGAQRSANPEVQRLQNELETRRRADDDAFVQGITQTTQKYVDQAFTKNAEVYLKQLNLTDPQKADLLESFGQKLTEKLGADQAFNKQLAAYKSLKNRSADTVNQYIQSKVDESAKSIIDGLITARYGGTRRKSAPAPTGHTTTDNGATRVAQAPDISTWDMNKMESLGYENTAKKGIFFLQGGRQVQVVKQ